MALTKRERDFRKIVWQFYRKHGRDALPWRSTTEPYKILVSELMLQQTQVERVIPKYESFMKRWPTAKRLANASLGEVLKAWQGLGYNRRAKFLHQTAIIVTKVHNGMMPKTEKELRLLPGLGEYTAKAIMAFAYNKPVSLIETNVRQVFTHHFFKEEQKVSDSEILEIVTKTLPKDRAGEWYAALMDYGTYLKKQHGNITTKSKTYQKQSQFKGSNREIRGNILKLLATRPHSESALFKNIDADITRLKEQLAKLVSENLVTKKASRYQLPE